jgi:hypothetical protein
MYHFVYYPLKLLWDLSSKLIVQKVASYHLFKGKTPINDKHIEANLGAEPTPCSVTKKQTSWVHKHQIQHNM